MATLRAAGERKETVTGRSKSQRAFSPTGILVSDRHGTRAPLFSSAKPLLTSAGCAWTGIAVEEHYLPPMEFPARANNAHLIAVHFRPATIEWLLGGHPQTKRMKRGSLDIVPQGTSLGGHS